MNFIFSGNLISSFQVYDGNDTKITDTDAVIKHVTDIEMSCEKNQKLSALEIQQRKDSIFVLLIVGFLMMIMIMILEYGVTS